MRNGGNSGQRRFKFLTDAGTTHMLLMSSKVND